MLREITLVWVSIESEPLLIGFVSTNGPIARTISLKREEDMVWNPKRLELQDWFDEKPWYFDEKEN